MDCKTAKEYIDMYVDDMLDDAEKQQLMFHVQSCEQCKKEYENAMRLKAALSDLDELEPPEGLAHSAIRKARRRKVPSFTYITAAVAAAVALVVVLSSGMLSGQKMHMLERSEESAQDMAYDEGATEMTKSAGLKEDFYADQAPAEAAEPEMGFNDVQEAEPMEEPASDVPMATEAPQDQSDVVGVVGSVFIPTGSEDTLERLEEFIKENDIIVADENRGGDKRVISFIVEERIYNKFIELIEELELHYVAIQPDELVDIIIE